MAAVTPVRVASDEYPPNYKEIVIKLLAHSRGGYSFRKFNKGYQACYASALVYILISMFPGLTEDEIVERISPIERFRNFQYSYLSCIISRNEADATSVTISNIRQVEPFLEDDIVFLGLVSSESYYLYGVIYHYFVLKKVGQEYFIYSSYGSQNVAIKQYVTRVDVDEFNTFMECLAKPDKSPDDRDKIDELCKFHFLDTRHKIEQNRTTNDYEEIFGEVYPKEPTEEQKQLLLKNKEIDVAHEIKSYQRGPIYLKVFPYTKDVLAYELALLELQKNPDMEATCRGMYDALEVKMAGSHRLLEESTPLTPQPRFEESFHLEGEEIDTEGDSPIDPTLGFDISEEDINDFTRKNPDSPIAERVKRRRKGGRKSKRKSKKRKSRKVC